MKENHHLALAKIIEADNLPGVLELIQDGADVNDLFENGQTPLLFASSLGYAGIVNCLIQRGASLNLPDSEGKTPLIWAVSNGFIETAKVLIDAGSELNAKDINGYTALSYAIKDSRGDLIRLLIEHGATDVESSFGNKFTALMRVTLDGETDLALKLLKENADANAQDKNGNTPLSFAVMSGYPLLVKILLSFRAEPGKEFSTGLSDLSPEQASYFLVKIAEANHKQLLDGNFIRAAENDDLKTLKEYLSAGADINYDNQGMGLTALMFAARNGNRSMVEYLLAHGADVNIMNEKMGWTAVSLASLGGYKEIVWLLMEYGADIDIFSASLGGLFAFVKTFIENGTDVDAKDFVDRTPLCMAATSGQLDIAKYLLTKGANINITDKFGETVLHKAARYGYHDIVNLFLEKGIDPEMVAGNGKIPVELAHENEHKSVVEILEGAGIKRSESSNSRLRSTYAVCGKKSNSLN